jgi:hypothetical protein
VQLTKRVLAIATLILALTAGTAQATPFSFTIGDADWFGTGLPMPAGPGPWPAPIWTTDAAVDRRSAGEASATDGAQLTDLYSAIFFSDWCDPGDQLVGGGTNPDCSPNGSEGTFILPFNGTLQSATITMLLGDFQCSQWFAVSADINGISQPFCFNHGYQMAGIETITLTPEMITAANLAGQIRLHILNSGNSLDYFAFDYVTFAGDIDGGRIGDPIPEPSTLALFASGLVIVWGATRRRMRLQAVRRSRT